MDYAYLCQYLLARVEMYYNIDAVNAYYSTKAAEDGKMNSIVPSWAGDAAIRRRKYLFAPQSVAATSTGQVQRTRSEVRQDALRGLYKSLGDCSIRVLETHDVKSPPVWICQPTIRSRSALDAAEQIRFVLDDIYDEDARYRVVVDCKKPLVALWLSVSDVRVCMLVIAPEVVTFAHVARAFRLSDAAWAGTKVLFELCVAQEDYARCTKKMNEKDDEVARLRQELKQVRSHLEAAAKSNEKFAQDIVALKRARDGAAETAKEVPRLRELVSKRVRDVEDSQKFIARQKNDIAGLRSQLHELNMKLSAQENTLKIVRDAMREAIHQRDAADKYAKDVASDCLTHKERLERQKRVNLRLSHVLKMARDAIAESVRGDMAYVQSLMMLRCQGDGDAAMDEEEHMNLHRADGGDLETTVDITSETMSVKLRAEDVGTVRNACSKVARVKGQWLRDSRKLRSIRVKNCINDICSGSDKNQIRTTSRTLQRVMQLAQGVPSDTSLAKIANDMEELQRVGAQTRLRQQYDAHVASYYSKKHDENKAPVADQAQDCTHARDKSGRLLRGPVSYMASFSNDPARLSAEGWASDMEDVGGSKLDGGEQEVDSIESCVNRLEGVRPPVLESTVNSVLRWSVSHPLPDQLDDYLGMVRFRKRGSPIPHDSMDACELARAGLCAENPEEQLVLAHLAVTALLDDARRQKKRHAASDYLQIRLSTNVSREPMAYLARLQPEAILCSILTVYQYRSLTASALSANVHVAYPLHASMISPEILMGMCQRGLLLYRCRPGQDAMSKDTTWNEHVVLSEARKCKNGTCSCSSNSHFMAANALIAQCFMHVSSSALRWTYCVAPHKQPTLVDRTPEMSDVNPVSSAPSSSLRQLGRRLLTACAQADVVSVNDVMQSALAVGEKRSIVTEPVIQCPSPARTKTSGTRVKSSSGAACDDIFKEEDSCPNKDAECDDIDSQEACKLLTRIVRDQSVLASFNPDAISKNVDGHHRGTTTFQNAAHVATTMQDEDYEKQLEYVKISYASEAHLAVTKSYAASLLQPMAMYTSAMQLASTQMLCEVRKRVEALCIIQHHCERYDVGIPDTATLRSCEKSVAGVRRVYKDVLSTLSFEEDEPLLESLFTSRMLKHENFTTDLRDVSMLVRWLIRDKTYSIIPDADLTSRNFEATISAPVVNEGNEGEKANVGADTVSSIVQHLNKKERIEYIGAVPSVDEVQCVGFLPPVDVSKALESATKKRLLRKLAKRKQTGSSPQDHGKLIRTIVQHPYSSTASDRAQNAFGTVEYKLGSMPSKWNERKPERHGCYEGVYFILVTHKEGLYVRIATHGSLSATVEDAKMLQCDVLRQVLLRVGQAFENMIRDDASSLIRVDSTTQLTVNEHDERQFCKIEYEAFSVKLAEALNVTVSDLVS